MIRDSLNALKTKANITCAEWSNLSTVPEATIRKILSGETPDPRFDTIFKLVTSVGGSIDDVIGSKKESEIENNDYILKEDGVVTEIDGVKTTLNNPDPTSSVENDATQY